MLNKEETLEGEPSLEKVRGDELKDEGDMVKSSSTDPKEEGCDKRRPPHHPDDTLLTI